PFTGKATVLRRPPDMEPEEYLRPGLHRPSAGSHDVVWFDPAILDLTVEDTDEGLEDALLRPTASEPARGLQDYNDWRELRDRRVQSGSKPTKRVQRITESEATLDGESKPEVVSLDEAVSVRRIRGGRKFGDLVHALLAQAPIPA